MRFINKEKYENLTLGDVGIGALCVGVVLAVIFGIAWIVFDVSGPWVFNDKTIIYKVDTGEDKSSVTVEHIIKEKGKEDIYCLSFGSGSLPDEIEVSASTFEEYIGVDNNTITFQYSEVCFYVADAFFGFSFDNSKIFGARRYCLPWEEKSIAFTDSEIKTFKTELIKNKNGLNSRDLSFEFDSFYTGHSTGSVTITQGKKDF